MRPTGRRHVPSSPLYPLCSCPFYLPAGDCASPSELTPRWACHGVTTEADALEILCPGLARRQAHCQCRRARGPIVPSLFHALVYSVQGAGTALGPYKTGTVSFLVASARGRRMAHGAGNVVAIPYARVQGEGPYGTGAVSFRVASAKDRRMALSLAEWPPERRPGLSAAMAGARALAYNVVRANPSL
jgi:hypothetical protein